MQQDNQFLVDMASRDWEQVIDIPFPLNLEPGQYSIYFCGVAKNNSQQTASGKIGLTLPGGTNYHQQVYLQGNTTPGSSLIAINITAVINVDPGYAHYASLHLNSSCGGSMTLDSISFIGVRIDLQAPETKTKKCQCTSSELFSKGCQCGGE
jgi:hypothetical protein